MTSLAFLIIGFLLGYNESRILTLVDKLKDMNKKAKPEVGITPGAYHKANENNVNQGGDTGLVMPKTPQRLEWEEQERLRRDQLGGR